MWHRPRSLAFCVVLGAVSVTWSCSTVVFLVLIFATTRQHMGRSSDDKTVVSMPDYVLKGNNSHNMCVTHRRIRRNENGVPQSSGADPSKRDFFTPPRRRAQNFEHGQPGAIPEALDSLPILRGWRFGLRRDFVAIDCMYVLLNSWRKFDPY